MKGLWIQIRMVLWSVAASYRIRQFKGKLRSQNGVASNTMDLKDFLLDAHITTYEFIKGRAVNITYGTEMAQ